MNIQITDRSGKLHSLAWETGPSLMDIMRDADLVLASCGGHCLCGTCHVYVDAATLARLPPRTDDEIVQLEQMRGFRPEASRLSCRIPFAQARDDMNIVLGPDE